eukprot:193825_1
MAVGLTVDYVIHITHAIVDEMNNLQRIDDGIYAEKVKIAMSDMGSSVLKGAFTTFLGVVALAFSQSQAFRIFFFMFLGIIVIAVAHGVILVPALLGEFRFIYKGSTNGIDKFALETHSTLNKKSDIEMLEYSGDKNKKQNEKNNVMKQIVSLKDNYPELENKLDDIMLSVNKLMVANKKELEEENDSENENKNDEVDQILKGTDTAKTDILQKEHGRT